MYKYLVVKCDELGDQWECDADRQPICLVEDYGKYDVMGYEIYEIQEDGTFELIRHYNDVERELICVYWWEDAEDKFERVEKWKPDKLDVIIEGTREDVTLDLIKKIKIKYHFADTVEEIERDIQCSGNHSEMINNEWVVFGETFDEFYPKGF